MIINNRTTNTTILVDWDNRNIVHCKFAKGSKEFKALLKKGYVEVGNIKAKTGKIYWESTYFNDVDKYLRKV